MFDIQLWQLRYKKLRWVLRQGDRLSLLRRGIAPSLEHADLLQDRSYAAVIDVGTNRGQFALFALEHFALQELVCIDPQLFNLDHVATRSATKHCQLRTITAALSDHPGAGTLRQTRATDSSSLLSPTASATTRHRGLKIRSEFEVPLRTGDDLIADDLQRPLLMKIDVQGSELDVLRGATTVLRNVDAVLVEVSFAQMYSGQPKPQEVIQFLLGCGFELSATAAVPSGRSNWRLDQADLLFERKLST